MQELRGYGTTTAQLLAMVGWLRLWRVQRLVMESAKQYGIPDTKSAVTPDLLGDAYPASAVDGHMIASDLGRDLRRRC